MKNQKVIRAFEAISLAMIIVGILNLKCSLLLMSANVLEAMHMEWIISIITVLFPIIIFFLLKVALGIWYLINSKQDNIGDPMMP